mmetsp:Transcript_117218/g.338893  ORF Transcript_117218/g.338893 Transcript_117218/m.338893 type:complete len:220 (-) Transcript_117218:275-934(-)
MPASRRRMIPRAGPARRRESGSWQQSKPASISHGDANATPPCGPCCWQPACLVGQVPPRARRWTGRGPPRGSRSYARGRRRAAAMACRAGLEAATQGAFGPARPQGRTPRARVSEQTPQPSARDLRPAVALAPSLLARWPPAARGLATPPEPGRAPPRARGLGPALRFEMPPTLRTVAATPRSLRTGSATAAAPPQRTSGTFDSRRSGPQPGCEASPPA